jgi:hypothetical protein
MNRGTAVAIMVIIIVDSILIGSISYTTFFAPKVIAQVDHPCLAFADGHHALVKVAKFDQLVMNWAGIRDYCEGHDETLKWLFSTGYEVKHMSDIEIILERTTIPQNQSALDEIQGQRGEP